MSDATYLAALRGVIDEYELEVAPAQQIIDSARLRLQERLQQLLGTEHAGAPIEPSPAGETATGELTAASTTPPAAPLGCERCNRTFPSPHALRVHRGRAHKEAQEVAQPPREEAVGAGRRIPIRKPAAAARRMIEQPAQGSTDRSDELPSATARPTPAAVLIVEQPVPRGAAGTALFPSATSHPAPADGAMVPADPRSRSKGLELPPRAVEFPGE